MRTVQGFFGRAACAVDDICLHCFSEHWPNSLMASPCTVNYHWSSGNYYSGVVYPLTSHSYESLPYPTVYGAGREQPLVLCMWVDSYGVHACYGLGDPHQKWTYNKNLAPHTFVTSIPCFPMYVSVNDAYYIPRINPFLSREAMKVVEGTTITP